MPNNAPILFQFGGFAEGYCPASYQQLGNDFAQALSGYLPGAYITVVTGDTEPAAIDRDKPWIRSDGRWYQYAAPGLGQWVARHPVAPGVVIMYAAAAEADIWAFDGGDGSNPSSSAPTASTGAMWEMVSELSGKIPIGPGTLAVSGTVLTTGSTGGVDQYTITQGNLPDVDLQVRVKDGISSLSPDQLYGYSAGGGSNNTTFSATGHAGSSIVAALGGSDTPINNMPPYYSIYFIRRTARIWYTI